MSLSLNPYFPFRCAAPTPPDWAELPYLCPWPPPGQSGKKALESRQRTTIKEKIIKNDNPPTNPPSIVFS